MFQQIRILLVALVLSGGFIITDSADACPMCQVANEDAKGDADQARPRAYMYSILFMLAMPATLFTAFGISFYRLAQKRTAMNEELLASSSSAPGNPLTPPDSSST